VEKIKIEIRRRSKSWMIFLIQAYLMLGLFVAGLVYALNPSGFFLSPETAFHFMCSLYLGLTIWFFVSWYLSTERLFDPYVLFLIASTIFNGGQGILEVFGLNVDGYLHGKFSFAESLQIIYTVALGIGGMHAGALLCLALEHKQNQSDRARSFLEGLSGRKVFSQLGELRQPSRLLALPPALPPASHQSFLSDIIPLNSALAVGKFFFYISILPVLITVLGAIVAARAGGYESLYQNQATGAAGAATVIADFLFPGVYLIVAAGNRAPRLRTAALWLMMLYTVGKMATGTRGAATMPLLALLWLWDRVVKPVPRGLLIGGALFLLIVVFPFIGATRNETAGVDPTSIDFITKTLFGADNPLVASISEMGFSATTIGWTYDLVPKVRPFAMGSSFLVAVLTLIPNVFAAGRHPALTMTGYDIPDFWLVSEIDKEFFERGGSFGFSFIAEAYLNFGWFGILYMIALGFAFAKFVQWSMKDGDGVKMAIVATFVSFFLFYPRGSVQMICRPFLWYAVFPYIGMRWVTKMDEVRAKNLVKSIRKGR
jgi:oligosaccharide repeat unit polymerase